MITATILPTKNPPHSKIFLDSLQRSVGFNVQYGGRAIAPKKVSSFALQNTPAAYKKQRSQNYVLKKPFECARASEDNRELKQRRRRDERQKSNRLDKQNNNFARASRLFRTFLCRHRATTT